MLLSYKDVTHIHVEVSSLCNARCPLCPRNLYGVNRDDLGYREHVMTLLEFKTIFPSEFIWQINEILFNGNFGDSIMNHELVDIIDYVQSINPMIRIKSTTNGGARDRKFWQRLAELGVYVIFSIDGLEDTNHLYRQDVNWATLMDNATTFIRSGGQAEWKMVRFDHNQHQIKDMEILASRLGFAEFSVTDHNRNVGPVFDRRGNFSHSIGNYTGPTEYTVFLDQLLKQKKQSNTVQSTEAQSAHWHARSGVEPAKNIRCVTQQDKSIYVSSVGEVYPCCFWGFATGDHRGMGASELTMIRDMIKDHNALEHGLEHAMEWFQRTDSIWNDQPTIGICHYTCGIDTEQEVVFYKNDERKPMYAMDKTAD